MYRLIVNRSGRRVFGWAYPIGGSHTALHVELLYQGEVIERSIANLTLPEGNMFLTHAEHRSHGFKFLLEPYYLSNPGSLVVRLVESKLVRSVPEHILGPTGKDEELHVDSISFDEITGWSWNPVTPGEPATVELCILRGDAERMRFRRSYTANLFRPDLVKFGFAGGNCGFKIRWPSELSFADRGKALLRMGRLYCNVGAKYTRLREDKILPLPRYVVSL